MEPSVAIHWKLMKDQNCVFKISAQKYLSKRVQYSKRTFKYSIWNETDPNYVRFIFREKLGKTMNDVLIKNPSWKHLSWFLPNFSNNKNHTWSGSISIWIMTTLETFWTQNHFLEIFANWVIGKTILTIILCIFRPKDQKIS